MRLTGAEADLQTAARKHVSQREIFGQPERAFPADRNDRRAELYPLGALRGRREKHRSRAHAVLQVALPYPGAVVAQLFAVLEELKGLLQAGVRVVVREIAGGEKGERSDAGHVRSPGDVNRVAGWQPVANVHQPDRQ